MPANLVDDKSTLVQVMAWCHQETSYYMNWCWPRFLISQSLTREHWVKRKMATEYMKCIALLWHIGDTANKEMQSGSFEVFVLITCLFTTGCFVNREWNYLWDRSVKECIWLAVPIQNTFSLLLIVKNDYLPHHPLKRWMVKWEICIIVNAKIVVIWCFSAILLVVSLWKIMVSIQQQLHLIFEQ